MTASLETALLAFGVLVSLTTLWSGWRTVRNGVSAVWPWLAPLAALLAIAGRWHRVGQGPFLTYYEVLLSNYFSLGLMTVALATWPPFRSSARYLQWLVLALGVWALTLSNEPRPFPPAFENPWLWAHVIAGKLYLGFLAAAAAMAVHLIRIRWIDSTVHDALWRCARYAFACDAVMLVAGAAWADAAWGQYWSWDPLETSALVNWLLLGLLLHLHAGRSIRPRTAFALIPALLALAVWTFLGIPYISAGPHKGFLG